MKIIDRATGEVLEWEYKDESDLAEQYWTLSKQIDALTILKEDMRNHLIKLLDDEDKLEAGRFLIKKEVRTLRDYDKSTLAKYLDPDQLEVVLQPDKKLTRELLNELAEQKILTAEDKKDIENSMIPTGGYQAIKVEPVK